MKYKSFETDRLILKPTDSDDAAFIMKLVNTPKWLKFIGDRNIHSEEEATIYIRERMSSQLEKFGFSNYTLILKSNGEKIGSCGLYNREGLEYIDLGYALLPEFERKGYAYEASEKLVEISQSEFNLQTLQAITSKENTSSQMLLKKLNFTNNDCITLPGESEELLLFTRNSTV